MSQDKDVICVVCGGEWEGLGSVYSGAAVRVADRAGASAQLFGREIISSSDVKHQPEPVIIVPAYFGTRRGTLGYARSEGGGERLVDPYVQ